VSAPVNAPPRGRYVEVCAGAGGWGLGLHAAGWTGTGMERDADASETHRRHVGPCLTADVTVAATPHRADFVCGGVPCQPFSTAGDREGLDDPRGQLFRALLRHGTEAGARCVAMENVRGLISCGALPVILDAFRAAGFDPVHALLNACDFGVPQSRVRLFIVGFRDASDLARFRWPQPTHGAPGNLFGLPPWRTVREALGLGGGAFRSGRIDGASGWNGQRMLDVDAPAPAPAVTSGRNPELIGSRLDRPAPTIGAGGADTGGAEPLANAKTRRELLGALAAARLIDRPSTTVSAHASGRLDPAGHHEQQGSRAAVRLVPRDCARLQSFPDAMEFVGDVTSQFKQIGNAVPPLLGEAVGRSVWAALYGGAP